MMTKRCFALCGPGLWLVLACAVASAQSIPTTTSRSEDVRAQETRPLDAPGSRAVPAGEAATTELVRSLRWTIDAEERRLAAAPDRVRADLVATLKGQVVVLESLLAARSALVVESTEAARSKSGRETDERRAVKVRQELVAPTGLTEPNADDAEAKLRNERATAASAAKQVETYRVKVKADLDRFRKDSESAASKLPGAANDLSEARATLAAAERSLERSREAGMVPDGLRVLEEKVWTAKAEVAWREAESARLELLTGSAADDRVRNLNFKLALEDDKRRMYEAKAREAARRLVLAQEARSNRAAAEVERLSKEAAVAPSWMADWYTSRIRIAELRRDAFEAQRRAESWTSRLSESGEIRALEAESEADLASLKEVEAGRLEAEVMTSGTAPGIKALIEGAESDLAAVGKFLVDARDATRDMRENLRRARSESPDDLGRRVEGYQATFAVPAGVSPSNDEERRAAGPRAFSELGTEARLASKECADALSGLQKQLGDSTTRLVELRTRLNRVLLFLEREQRWVRDTGEWTLNGLLSELRTLPVRSSEVAAGVAAAHVGVWRDVVALGAGGPSAWGPWVVLAAILGVALIAPLLSSGAFRWPEPGPQRAFRVARAVIGALGRCTSLPLLVALAGWIPALLVQSPPSVRGPAFATGGVLSIFLLGRSLVNFLLGATAGHARVLHTSDEMAEVLRQTFRRLLWLGVSIAPFATLADVFSGRTSEWGAFLWATLSFGIQFTLLWALWRPSYLPAVIRSAEELGGSSRFVRFVAHPLAIGVVVFLLALQLLSYSVAFDTFRNRFFFTASWFFLAWAVRGWIIRSILGTGRELSAPPREPSPTTSEWTLRAAAYFKDRTLRFIGSLLYWFAAIPVCMTWDLWGVGWEANLGAKIPFVSDTLTIGNLLEAVITVCFMSMVIRWIRDALRYKVLPATDWDPGLRYTCLTLSTYALVAGVAIFVLNRQLQLDAGKIGWFVTALGLGVGFGLQEIINNFVSGLILLVERPIKVGDMVVVDGVTGRVEVINMRSTTVMTGDNMGLIVPNKDLIASKVTNWSSGTPCVRVAIPVGVAYGTDLAAFEKRVMDVVHAHAAVLKDPAPELTMTAFGASSLDFEVGFFVPLTAARGKIRGDVLRTLERELVAAGIEIPYPRQDVRVVGMPSEKPRA